MPCYSTKQPPSKEINTIPACSDASMQPPTSVQIGCGRRSYAVQDPKAMFLIGTKLAWELVPTLPFRPEPLNPPFLFAMASAMIARSKASTFVTVRIPSHSLFDLLAPEDGPDGRSKVWWSVAPDDVVATPSKGFISDCILPHQTGAWAVSSRHTSGLFYSGLTSMLCRA